MCVICKLYVYVCQLQISNSRTWKEVWIKTKYIEQKQRLAKDAERKKQLEEQETEAHKEVEVETTVAPQKRSLVIICITYIIS